MAPKEDKKGGDKKGGDPVIEKFQADILALTRAKEELEIEYSLLIDKLKQVTCDKHLLADEIEGFRARFDKTTKDYADILEIREKAVEETREQLTTMHEHLEQLREQLQSAHDEISRLQALNAAQAEKLVLADEILDEKMKLEDAVKKQMELIDKQSNELKLCKASLADKDEALDKARVQIDELTLKAGSPSNIKIMLGECWFISTVNSRLKGTLPLDREHNSLSCLSGGKALILYGGASRSNADAGNEAFLLNLDTLAWERLENARTPYATHSHTTSVLGRTKLMVYGGLQNDSTVSSSANVLNVDNQKWSVPVLRGSAKPSGRYGQAAAWTRDKMFMFGGVAEDGTLLNDFWTFDTDSNQWIDVICYGTPPCPRKGATLCSTEDGAKVFLFGGHNGEELLNDVHILDLNRSTWSMMSCLGQVPEPRQGHVAGLLGSGDHYYMVVTGGNNGSKFLAQMYCLDVAHNKWGCMDDGSSNTLMWLKAGAVYSTFYGNRLITLKPNLHEGMDELSVTEFTLPEDIERTKAAQRDQVIEIDELEIMADAMCSANTIDLSWRAPTKNSDRIDKFKLMVAMMSGAVKELCQGKMTSFKVTGLKPNMEYVFSVKAIYEDGSFLRSEPRSFRTRT